MVLNSAVTAKRRRLSLQLAPLVTFGRLAREGSFTRTAEALQLTQPAVSQHVRALERHFGVRLVAVVGRRVVLTAAGSFLAERTARIAESVAATEREMRHFADVQMGELRVGATVTIGTYTLTPIVQYFRESHPGIIMRFTLRDTARIATMVKRGELELALVEGLVEDDELDIIPYADDELTLVVPQHHHLAKLPQPIAVDSLAGEPFIARGEGSGIRALVESALRAAGVEPNVVLELPSGESIARAVAAGIGVSIISPIITDRAVPEAQLVKIPIARLGLRRTFRIIRLRCLTPSPAAEAFMALTLRINASSSAFD
jgi:DNA-binding transcriptional LysR family regulator